MGMASYTEREEPTMSTQLERLAIELLGLPTQSRAMLATQLIASLDETELPEIQEKWVEVAKRRAAEMVNGKVKGIVAEDVFRELDEETE
jgi:hypothetical protein